jgi:hypothetical protein
MTGISKALPVDLGAMLLPDGAGGETLPSKGTLSNIGAVASGTLQGTIIPVVAGSVISTLTFCSGTTAATTPTNQWAAISRYSDRAVLGKSPDLSTAPIAAEALMPHVLTSPVTITATDHYVFWLLVVASVVPTMRGATANNALYAQEKRAAMRADTGLTVPGGLGAATAAYTNTTNMLYCKWS